MLAKVDLEHAYQNIPIHRDNRLLLAMRWRGKLYLDTVLPFGLRSAPKIFSAIADALGWILLRMGVTACIHYLDNFLVFGKPTSEQCQCNLELVLRICKFLGVPLKAQKMEGPSVVLNFLGILLDTVEMQMKLPTDKIEELKELIQKWERYHACKKRQLLSLIGKLAHAARVVKPGRIFLRHMIDAASKAIQYLLGGLLVS